MENAVSVYLVILGLIIGMMVFQGIQNDENLSQRLARVRVRVDERDRRRPPDRPDEEFERQPQVEKLVLATVFIFLLLLLQALS